MTIVGEVLIPPLDPDSGPELAYETLLHGLEGLQRLDREAPIVGSFRVTEVPDSRLVPLGVREQWVDVDVPVRFPRTLGAGGVEFSNQDAVLSLLAAGRIEAARWFADHQQGLLPGWMFNLTEGILTEIDGGQEPQTSIEYYGSFLVRELRAEIEQPAED